jgi:hypothetical protein
VLPLAGAPTAEVKLTFGAGTLTTGVAAPGNLIDGSFRGASSIRNAAPARPTSVRTGPTACRGSIANPRGPWA